MRLDHPFEPYHTFESWFSYDLPLLASDGRLDRCLCRYVTQPLFLARLPPTIRTAVERLEARPPEIALHLRTMANHLPREMRTSPACEREHGDQGLWEGRPSAHDAGSIAAAATATPPTPTPLWHRWLFSACRERAFRVAPRASHRVFVMSDSPRLLLRLGAGYPGRVIINQMTYDDVPMINQTAEAARKSVDDDAAPYRAMLGDGGGRARAPAQVQRQWERTQQLLGLDFHIASLASEIQTDRESSFALPLTARSLCVRNVRYLSSPSRLYSAVPSALQLRQGHGQGASLCPEWASIFPRTLPHLFSRHPWHYHACYERPAAPNHPCKGLSPEQCHASFIAAV